MKRIFVSSTFKDMNYERDILQERVMPELNEIARQYGESVSVCDLRWGVNTEEMESEEGSKKVLSVCLDEIDSCRPYMIVILGERYGWIPSEALIADTVENRRGFALDELEKSVTALEIEYGALQREDRKERVLFYFREMTGDAPEEYQKEDDEHQEKLRRLKERILAFTGGNVKSYTVSWDAEKEELLGMEAFADLVVSDVHSMMKEEWQEYAALTPYQKDQRLQWELVRTKAAAFHAREEKVHELLMYLGIRDNMFKNCKLGLSYLALKGKAGSGKSMLMSRLAMALEERDMIAKPIFCGSTDLCSDAMGIVQYMVYLVEELLGKTHFSDLISEEEAKKSGKRFGKKEWRDRLAAVMKEYAEKAENPKLFFVIDGVEQLAADEERDLMRFIPDMKLRKVKIIFSCLDSFPLFGKKYKILNIVSLNENERMQVVEGILESERRSLAAPVILEMISRDASADPMYLSLLVQRLLMMDREDFAKINAKGGGMNEITNYQLELIKGCADDLAGLSEDILEAAIEKIGGAGVRTAVEYLSSVKYGLKELDLMVLCMTRGTPWDGLDFARFRRYMSSFVVMHEDGRYGFSNSCFCTEGVGDKNKKQRHMELIEYFGNQGFEDALNIKEFIYQCIFADASSPFLEFLLKYKDNTDVLSVAGKTLVELLRYDGGRWLKNLLQNGMHNRAGTELVEFVNQYVVMQIPAYKANLDWKLEIMLKAISFSNELDEAEHSFESKCMRAKCYDLTGDICIAYGTEKRHTNALNVYRKAWRLYKELSDMGYGQKIYKERIQNYGRLGLAYRKLGGNENFESAVKCYENSSIVARNYSAFLQQQEDLSLDGKRAVAESYRLMGEARGSIDSHRDYKATYQYKKALADYEQAVRLWSQIAEETQKPEDKKELALCYYGIGKIYFQIEEEELFEKSKEFYQKALELFEELLSFLYTNEMWANLALSYTGLAACYTKKPPAEPEKKYIVDDLYGKALKIVERLIKETLNQEYKNLEIEINMAYGDYLCEKRHYDSAINKYKLIAGESLVLVKESGTLESRQKLADAYGKCGFARHQLAKNKEWFDFDDELEIVDEDFEINDEEDPIVIDYSAANARESLQYYQKEKEIRDSLVDKLKSYKGYKEQIDANGHVGCAHCFLGGEENLRTAAEYFEKEVQLYNQLIWKYQIDKKDFNLRCERLIYTYRRLGDEESLKKISKIQKIINTW